MTPLVVLRLHYVLHRLSSYRLCQFFTRLLTFFSLNTLYRPMHGYKHLPSAHPDHRRDSDISGYDTSFESLSQPYRQLSNEEVHSGMLSHAGESVLSGGEHMNLSGLMFLSAQDICRFLVWARTFGHHSQPKLCLPLILHLRHQLEVLSQIMRSYFQETQALVTYTHIANKIPSRLHSLCTSLDPITSMNFTNHVSLLKLTTLSSLIHGKNTISCLKKTTYSQFFTQTSLASCFTAPNGSITATT